MYYEYSKLNNGKKIKIDVVDKDANEVGLDVLQEFACQLNNAVIFEESKQPEKENLLTKMQTMFHGIFLLFTHSHILVLFISWLVLLSLLFTVLLFIGLKVSKLNMDSTILVGYLSGIIVGALTITATIYSRRIK